MSSGIVVAIDGPSGSGKSSVSRAVAQRLGLAYLDTGAMYRAITWSCLAGGLDLADGAAVAKWAHATVLDLGTDPAGPSVIATHPVLGRVDVSSEVREPRISAAVSAVATNLDVRAQLIEQQRNLIAQADHGIVAEGRDITTVVAPDAAVRVLLTASEESRLARRAAQDEAAGAAQASHHTRDQVLRRDAHDATVASFHTAADGVVTVDSSHLSFEQTVAAIIALVDSTRSENPSQ